jgi:TolB-like protein/cytochrome c-type biogenesis protein CcmH/NrfG
MPGSSFFAELRERKVPQVAAIYVAVAWGVTEIAVTVVEQLFLPQWVATLAVIGFVVGFPIAMFLAWTFDITSEGIQRTEVTSRRGQASIAFALALLLAGTGGLFLLIKPSLDSASQGQPDDEIPPNSIAVLPFENASGNEDDAYLSEGLSDELRDQLGRAAGVRIAARSSSFAAVTRGLDALAASEQLNVALVVEGSVRRQRNRLRVSVQLIDGRSGLSVWSDTFDRGIDELLAVQQTIAESILRELLPETQSIATAPATRNADANELMLLAQHYENQVRARAVRDDETLLKAIDLYRQATEADPEAALPYSRLARALLYLGDLAGAEAPIFKAMTLNPNLSEVQNTLGEFYWARGLPGDQAAYERALELNPYNADALHNYAHRTWLSLEAHHKGESNPGPLFRRALELDPLSLTRHAALGDYYGKDGYTEELIEVIENIERLFDDAEAYRVIGWLYELLGQLDVAIAWTIKALDIEPDNPDHTAKLADLYAMIGDVDTVHQLNPYPDPGVLFQLRRYEEFIDAAQMRMIEEPNDAGIRYLLGFAYVAVGEYQLAIHVLGSTGLPDTVLEGKLRTVMEGEAYMTLVNAMSASDIPEAVELAQNLARKYESEEWWGDIGWIGLYRSCNYAILGNDERALHWLARIKESPRLRPDPYLRDSWCYRRFADHPVYQDVLTHQDEQRAALRKRLPTTLETFGVSL